jgi:hypothetical protein
MQKPSLKAQLRQERTRKKKTRADKARARKAQQGAGREAEED